MTILAAIPVKPFGVAKARLAPLLDPPARARLGKAVAAHTAQAVAAAGAEPVLVTGDAGVARWARRQGLGAVRESGPGLDAAAASAVAAAAGRPWLVLHADLPLVTADDVRAVLDRLDAGAVVLAPSRDGGTTALAAPEPRFPFAYGPASFHRHLRAAAGRAAVVVRLGLALDLDHPADLVAARAHPAGAWLGAVLGLASRR